LARAGFYNGQSFHRVVPNFVVQAGDPRGDGNGGPGYTIRCEINTRPFLRGTLGMALSGKDTGGSQFFITLLPQPHLDGGYTVFGQVTRGMEVVDRLEPGDVIREIFIWDGGAAASPGAPSR
jgi:cyclophilin family peptidyl-prolyl cis-trans isomerase